MHAHTQTCIRMCTLISISPRSQIRLLLLSKPAVKSSIICIHQMIALPRRRHFHTKLDWKTLFRSFFPSFFLSFFHSFFLSFLTTAPRYPDMSFVLSDRQFLLRSSVTKARSQITPPLLEARTGQARIASTRARSRRSMGIDRVGKGALITGPRVQEKTAENRSLQLFRAAEHNRLPPASTARTEPAPAPTHDRGSVPAFYIRSF